MKKMLPFNKALLLVVGAVAVFVSLGIFIATERQKNKTKYAASATTSATKSAEVAPSAIITDIAKVIGMPVSHSTGIMVYPVLLVKTGIHTWLEANKLRYNPLPGEIVEVKYNLDDLRGMPSYTYHVQPLTPDSPEEVKRKTATP